MADIYQQHDAAFGQVSAFVVLKDGQRVATVALKYPRDGAGRLYAYVHWIGLEMTRGHAGGAGYDKRSAAVEAAARKMNECALSGGEASFGFDYRTFIAALRLSDGRDWAHRLRDAGFDVLQAV